MPKYNYKAVDLENNKISGKVEARDEADLRRILRSQNMVPIKYSVEEEKFTRYKLKANETAELSRQLASMLGSGITLVRALEIIQDRDFNKSLKLIYQKLYKDAQQGYTLSEAMRMQGRTFPELLLNMYASGEASGQLELVCNKMAVHYEKENRLNGKIKSAMMYPTVLFVVTVAVVLLIFAVILPQFFDLFKELELPLVTVIVMGISQFIQTNWYSVIIGSMCAVL
ncbi:MAG: type II secretion system F family protein, partial [Anaerotignaceae bacterium]